MVCLGSVEGFRKALHWHWEARCNDLALLRKSVPKGTLSRMDTLRFFLAYLGEDHLSESARSLVMKIVRRRSENRLRRADGRKMATHWLFGG
jgi:hypothetical protein